MNDVLLDTVIADAVDEMLDFCLRASIGQAQCFWIMTRDMYDYIVSDTEGQFEHVTFCEKFGLDSQTYARFYDRDIYIMLKGDPMRHHQISCAASLGGRLENLEWMQDGDYLMWDGDLFVRENGQIHGAQFEISRDVTTARTEYEEEGRNLRLNMREDVQGAVDRFVAAAFEPVAEIVQDGLRTDALYFDEFVDAVNVAQDAAVAATTAAVGAEAAVGLAWDANRAWDEIVANGTTADFIPRYTVTNGDGIHIDNIRAATITADNVQINLDALDGWTRAEPDYTYATTTTTNMWDTGYGHVYTPTWTITVGEDGECHIGSVEADKPVKEKEIKRSKKLDDFIDQYAPKK